MPHTQPRIADSRKEHPPAPFSLASPAARRSAVRCRAASCSACGGVSCSPVLCRAEPVFAVLSLSHLPDNASKHTELVRTSMHILKHLAVFVCTSIYVVQPREQQSTAQPPLQKRQTKHVPFRVRIKRCKYMDAASCLFSWGMELLAFASSLFTRKIMDHLLYYT